mmetsp:Transcript_5136/g.14415  ORF Transcript_5136/g.14415 Transcript_5136/m.14415 type:complete len:266 (+) Transcript_5136:1548-2345(+)
MKAGFFCPSRQTRAIACSSVAGFQSESNRMRWLAPTRFRPAPPALEESRNTSHAPQFSASTCCCLSSVDVLPSMRPKVVSVPSLRVTSLRRTASSMSSTFTKRLTTTTLSPWLKMLFTSSTPSRSLPLSSGSISAAPLSRLGWQQISLNFRMVPRTASPGTHVCLNRRCASPSWSSRSLSTCFSWSLQNTTISCLGGRNCLLISAVRLRMKRSHRCESSAARLAARRRSSSVAARSLPFMTTFSKKLRKVASSPRRPGVTNSIRL